MDDDYGLAGIQLVAVSAILRPGSDLGEPKLPSAPNRDRSIPLGVALNFSLSEGYACPGIFEQ